jgi:hypothetical protein
MSEKTTTRQNLDGDPNEISQDLTRIIKYFGGVPHVQVESRYRGYGGSEHIVRYWQPISKK